jgi:hypothetical protein
MIGLAASLTKECWAALGGAPQAVDQVAFESSGGLPSVFAVTDLASATIATAGLSLAELSNVLTGKQARIRVDRRLSSIWFWASIRPIGWQPLPAWDPIAGDYPASDGWIRLHTNAPHHKAAVQRVLGLEGNKEAIAQAVRNWSKIALETAVIEAGGCAAEMRSITEWSEHPQGQAISREPLVHLVTAEPGPLPKWYLDPMRPLAGLRVLDLTRVLAGPVATRFLAGFGAHVLRIDSQDWDEPAVVPEVTLGKRCARLDLYSMEDREVFEQLLSTADVVIHGYRPGALDRLGYSSKVRRELSPGLVDVSLDAYGWSGPWADRRGFDSLVQMSTGIADFGMKRAQADKPVPLPVQALDHATGYLLAAAAIRGVTCRLREGCGCNARLSLARTAQTLIAHPLDEAESALAPEGISDRTDEIETTFWGKAQRVLPPVRIDDISMRWETPARPLGSDPAEWF